MTARQTGNAPVVVPIVSSHDVEGCWMRWFSESLGLRLGPHRTAQLVDRVKELVDSAR